MLIVMAKKYIRYGEELRRAREATGLTQDDFADAIGEARTNYNNIENGTRMIPKAKRVKAAEILKIDIRSFEAWKLMCVQPLEIIEMAANISRQRPDLAS